MSVRRQTVARLTTVQKVCNLSMFLRVLICYGEAVGKMRELVGQVVGMVLFSLVILVGSVLCIFCYSLQTPFMYPLPAFRR